MSTRIEKAFTCSCGNENKIVIDTSFDDIQIVCRCKCGKRYKFIFGNFIEEESEEAKKGMEEEKEKEEGEEKKEEIKEEKGEEDILDDLEKKEEIERLGEVSSDEEDQLAGLFGLR
jgi:hypothetical protein